MMPRIRTALVALLVAVIALRWSLARPVSDITARIAADPWAAVRSFADGWTFAGTLGGGSVQGVRELPYALVLALGSDAGVPADALEAGWRVLVAVVAVLGAVRLARAVAVDGPVDGSWVPWAGALFFALGTVLVPTMVLSPGDGLATATLPWIVAPLLTRPPGWRAPAVSAAWLGLAGVGSAGWALAALAVGLLAVVPRRRTELAFALRWLLLAAAASAWWVVLLVWEARHTVDVSALVADTLRTDVAAALARPDAALLVVLAVVGGPIVVALGALGLRSPRLERFLVAALLVLVATYAVLYWSGVIQPHVPAPVAGGPAAGPAAPLLGVLGLAALLAWCPLVADLRDRLAWVGQERLPGGRREILGVLVAVVVGATVFAGIAATVAEPEPVDAADTDLIEAIGDWSADAPPGRVMVLPVDTGATDLSSTGAALGARPWIGRDAVPTSGAGGTAAVDDLVARLARGDGGQGTSSALRRLGIAYVLVRLGGPAAEDRDRPTALVRSALDSLEAERVAVLGSTPDEQDTGPVDYGVRTTAPLAEVWALPTTADGWVYADAPIDAVGDAGTVSDLADAGVLGDRAIHLRRGSDVEVPVVSDSARRRDVDQRVPTDPYGPDLSADESRSVLPTDAAPVTSAVVRFDGALAVTASSSAADLDGADREPGTVAAAAIDENDFTSWRSRRGSGVGEWWQVDFAGPTDVTGTTIQMRRSPIGAATTQVRVSADGRQRTYLVGDGGLVELGRLGEVRRLRVTITGVTSPFDDADTVGIVEVTIPDVMVTAPLVLDPSPTAGWLMALRPASATHCVPAAPQTADDDSAPGTACDDDLEVSGPDGGLLDRVVHVPRQTPVSGRAWFVAAEQAGALADRIAEPSVVASSGSTATGDPRARPQAAADDDLSTAWRAAPADREPRLTLAWPALRNVSGVRLIPPTHDLGAQPTRVRVTAEPVGRRTGEPIRELDTEVEVDSDGTIDLPPIRVRELTITVLDDTGESTTLSASGRTAQMPVTVGEVEIIGGPAVTYDHHRRERLQCDEGPVVTIDDTEVGTSVIVTPDEIVSGVPVLARVCGRPSLAAGDNRVSMSTTFDWWVRGLMLTPRGTGVFGKDLAPSPLAADVLSSVDDADPVFLGLGADDGSRTLVLPLPADSGWQASVGGDVLDAVTVDGWAQGWVVPAGSGQLTVRYASGAELAPLVLGASAGWLAVLVLGCFAAVRRPRVRRR